MADEEERNVLLIYDRLIEELEREIEEAEREREMAAQPPKLVGNFAPFDKKDETFTDFKTRFEDYCELNEHALGADAAAAPGAAAPPEGPKAKFKKLTFLNSLDRETRATLNRLCYPDPPRSKLFDVLCTALENHFHPKGLAVAEETTFQSLHQKEGQSAADFSLVLRSQASRCAFGDQLDNRLRTQFVTGLLSEDMKDKILDKGELTFDEALAAATHYENRQAQKKAEFEAREATVNMVNAVRARNAWGAGQGSSRGSSRDHGNGYGSGRGSSGSWGRGASKGTSSSASRGRGNHAGYPSGSEKVGCWRCGKRFNCDPHTCWARGAKCYTCDKVGHTAQYHRGQVRACEQEETEYEEREVLETHQEEAPGANGASDAGGTVKSLTFQCYEEPDYEKVVINRVQQLEDLAYIPASEGDLACDVKEALDWCSSIDQECGEEPEEISGVDENVEDCKVIVVNSVKQNDPLIVTVNINGVNIQTEVDSGAGATIMHVRDFMTYLQQHQYNMTIKKLRTLDGTAINVVGESTVTLKDRNGKEHSLKLTLCNTPKPFLPLIGRDWLDEVTPEWRAMGQALGINVVKNVKSIHVVQEGSCADLPVEIKMLLAKYTSVFSGDKSQAIKGYKARVISKENAIPMCLKEYEIAYHIKPTVTDQLRHMIDEGRFIPLTVAQWASPLFPIPKPDGTPRLCVDYKRAVNKSIIIDHYPLPKPEDIFSALAGNNFFCVLDLSEAYLQLELEPASQEILVVNTHIGFLKPTRMMFGVANAPAAFQEVMDKILKGLPHVQCYIDDVLIGAPTKESLLQTLEEVLIRFQQTNIRVKLSKCLFLKSQVEYLGHVISGKAIMPSTKRIKPIMEAAPPNNITELRSYLGSLNFYRKFLPNASTVLQPLTDLLKKDVTWKWTPQCQNSFVKSKEILMSNQVLTPYDPNKIIVLICDASQYGIGVTLAHRVNNAEFPICYGSATLTERQRDYSQIEREALAIHYGLTKFYKYLAGRTFVLVTDNMPLKAILAPDRVLPVVAAAKLKRCAVALSAFSYVAEYRKSSDMGTADMLSRLPSQDEVIESVNSVQVDNQELPVTPALIAQETAEDPVLSTALKLTLKGWPPHLSDPALQHYFDIRFCLSIEQNCLLFGERVIIPQKLRERVKELLHEGHPGIVRMKLRARTCIYWPGIAEDIEKFVRFCEPCAKVNFRPLSNVTIDWPSAINCWTRLHVDFFYFHDSIFFLLVDSFSKWVEVWPVPATSASAVIEKLRVVFGVFGLPLQIVSDNGPPFDSVEYLLFCTANDVVASKSPPYHPQSNGAAERTVQTVKRALKKLMYAKPTRLTEKLTNLLFQLRNIPSTVTKMTPADLMIKFPVRTPLSHLCPVTQLGPTYVPKVPVFNIGEQVLVRRRKGQMPEVGKIVKILGPVMFEVNIEEEIVSCHVNQMATYCGVKPQTTETVEPVKPKSVPNGNIPKLSNDQPMRRSLRTAKPPDRLNI